MNKYTSLCKVKFPLKVSSRSSGFECNWKKSWMAES